MAKYHVLALESTEREVEFSIINQLVPNEKTVSYILDDARDAAYAEYRKGNTAVNVNVRFKCWHFDRALEALRVMHSLQERDPGLQTRLFVSF